MVWGVLEKFTIKSYSSSCTSSTFSQNEAGTILTSTIVQPKCFIYFLGYFYSYLAGFRRLVNGGGLLRVGRLGKRGGGLSNKGGGGSNGGGVEPVGGIRGGGSSWGRGGRVGDWGSWLMFGGGGRGGKMNGLLELSGGGEDNLFKSWINLWWTIVFSLGLVIESLLILLDPTELLNPRSYKWVTPNLTPFPGPIFSLTTNELNPSSFLLFYNLSSFTLLKLINGPMTAYKL